MAPCPHRRPTAHTVLLAVVPLVLAAACAVGEDASSPEPAQETAPTSTGSTTTSAEAPSTTVESLVPCPADDPVVTATLDASRPDVGAWIVAHDGGQQLVLCDQEGISAVDLDPATWYLAVVETRIDGPDELFLGSADFLDTVDAPATKLYRVVSDGPDLLVDIAAGGVTIDPTQGPGCLDDGGDPTVDIGAAVSCGPGIVPLTRVAPPAMVCDESSSSTGPILVDLDGDGADDRVVQRTATGRAALEDPQGDGWDGWAVAVCLASGVVDQVLVGGQGVIFGVGRGPDGTPLIWTGGRTQLAVFRSGLVMYGDRLAFLLDPDGDVFSLWDGQIDTDTGTRWWASGCADLDGDAVEEFIEAEAAIEAGRLEWRRTTWHLDGRVATIGPVDAGTLPAPADPELVSGDELLGDLAPDDC